MNEIVIIQTYTLMENVGIICSSMKDWSVSLSLYNKEILDRSIFAHMPKS